MPTVTASSVDHYDTDDRPKVYWGTVNGQPIYMPLGTREIVVTIPATLPNSDKR